MYAAAKKDINRNKSFHAMTGANIAKREQLKGAKREREEEHEKRMATLEKEQREARLDAQIDAAEGNAEGFTAIQKRTAWMMETVGGSGGVAAGEEEAAGGNGDGSAGGEKGGASAGPTAAGSSTGTITKEEAEAARKRLSDEKKRRLDPLARADMAMDAIVRGRLATMQQQQQHQVGGGAAAPAQQARPVSGTTTNASRLQGLLQRARQ